MKNKKHIIAYIILMALPVLISVIALFFLPDQIPAHFASSGEADRWGSKYETLILPVTSIIFGVVMMIIAKFSSYNESSSKNNEKITLITGECCLVLFFAMQIYFLYLDFNSVSDINTLPISIGNIVSCFLGIFFMVIGNIMPKAKMNSLLGFRMPWTMKSEDIWKKSQHFAGIASIIFGLIILITSFFIKGMTAVYVCIGLIIIMSIIDLIYAYKISHTNN